jgi:murein DD-endopeptidase MepM/ murein hydrolase activator NlpD
MPIRHPFPSAIRRRLIAGSSVFALGIALASAAFAGALAAPDAVERGHVADEMSKPSEATGGLALPPRRCADPDVDALADADAGIAPASIGAMRRQLDCIAGGHGRFEPQGASHTLAWTALPGRLPVANARFGSPFGNRLDPFSQRLSFHSGIDLAARAGTPIHATAGGRVIFSGQKPGYGKVIEIDHGDALVTRYGHASRLVARKGDLVRPQQHIADVGSTGRSTGPHLHFELLRDGEAIDPSDYLRSFDQTRHGAGKAASGRPA